MQMTINDVADYFKVSRRTIYRWLEKGVIPAYKVNDQYRFVYNEIVDWATANRVNDSSSIHISHIKKQKPKYPLYAALQSGGIYYRIEGHDIKTMGQRLSDIGYHSVYIGNWHLDGHDYFGTGICPDGWDPDYWFDGINYLQTLSKDEIYSWRQGLQSYEDIKRENIKAESTWAHCNSDRAIDFLKNREKEKPYCLVVSFDEPHHPHTCPPEFVEPFNDFEFNLGPSAFDDLKNKPAHQKEWSAAMHNEQNVIEGKRKWPMYFGCNSFADHEVGRILQAVEKYSSEDTYIIYTSDHGDMLGGHKLESKGSAAYEEITHVPFIIKTPDKKLNSRTNTSIVSHIDILPTILEIAGQEPPPILEGTSLLPILSDKEQDVNREAIIEFNRYEIEHDSFGGFIPLRAIVSGDYKLVINLFSTDELYNLKHDPGELNNLISNENYFGIRDKLHNKLLNWMNEKRDPFRGLAWERRPWQKEQNSKWLGLYRPRPADGYAPPVLDYITGQPTKDIREN